MLTANSLTLCDYLTALPGMLRGRAFQRAALRRELAACFGVDEARIGLYDTGRAALRVLLQPKSREPAPPYLALVPVRLNGGARKVLLDRAELFVPPPRAGARSHQKSRIFQTPCSRTSGVVRRAWLIGGHLPSMVMNDMGLRLRCECSVMPRRRATAKMPWLSPRERDSATAPAGARAFAVRDALHLARSALAVARKLDEARAKYDAWNARFSELRPLDRGAPMPTPDDLPAL